MSYKPTYTAGQWNCVCDACGREFKSSELRKRWDGLMVCAGDWEPRQSQDFVHGVADKITPPWTRPEQQDQFVHNFCTPGGRSAVPAMAVPGCVIPNHLSTRIEWETTTAACNALYVLVDTDIVDYEYACNALVVDADLTLDGTVNIRTP